MIPYDAHIHQYVLSASTPLPSYISDIEREALRTLLHRNMLSGDLQGRLLSMLSTMMRPTHVLEIGTYIGYSALCLAQGLQKEGVIHSIDIDPEILYKAQKQIDTTPYSGQIHLHCGNAVNIIPSLNCVFDLVFIDGNKLEYMDYLDAVLPHTQKGSLIISDNVLWYGKVADQNESDPETKAIRAYNARLRTEPRLQTLTLPIRDGIALSYVTD